ncbi:MAG: IS256 family transposase [Erysipelotrichaceae bacterium]|nr:IS256 family transposase [Erysipelotrichaceae bacterium]
MLAQECKTMDEVQNRLRDMFKGAVEQMLEAEMDNHLGYEKHSTAGDNTGNSRNGYSHKTIQTKNGRSEIAIPRDRKASFEPQIVRKHQSTVNDIEEKIIAMYAKGLSTRDIEDHVMDIYGIEVSPSLVSRITDKITPEIAEWQARPLESMYPVVFLDAIHFRVRRDSRVVSKAAYTVLGINLLGRKNILGIWIGESESASFWLGVCNDLRSRGVKDILVVAKDGLSGFSDAVRTVFPHTDMQMCVIHQLRSCMKYVPWKERKQVVRQLKTVYQASTLDEAELRFEEFKRDWGKPYGLVVKAWERNWAEVTTFFSYPPEIRKLIYTTNPVEIYHRQLRKITKNKTTYPNDEALTKILYLGTLAISEKWTQPVQNWAITLAQLVIYFGDRVTDHMEVGLSL